MTLCECGRSDEDHSFKELLVCLYGDQGMTEAKAETVISGIENRLSDDAANQEGT